MRTELSRLGAAVAMVAAGIITISAQPPAQPPQSRHRPSGAGCQHVVENPTYVSIHLEVDVNRPAADVWKRVGDVL